jgi:hypothetical protein
MRIDPDLMFARNGNRDGDVIKGEKKRGGSESKKSGH